MDEQQAIHLLKAGDLQGLEPLVSLYYFRAVKTAYLIVQDRDEAEDIVQSAFLHAYEKINQLRSGRFGPWFLRSILNASIKTARKQKKNISLQAGDSAEALSFEEQLADHQPSPETIMEDEELSQAVWRVLQRLSPEHRAAVVMKYYLEMSEAEISSVLGRPLSTIKWRLFTARKQLRNLLHPAFHSPTADNNLTAPSNEKRE